MKVPSLGLQKFLLKGSDARVRKSHQAAVVKADVNQKAVAIAKDAPRDQESWSQHFTKLLQDSGMRWSQCKPDDKIARSVFYQSLPVREQFALGFQMAAMEGCTAVDVSQTIGRLYVSNDDILQCITPVCHMLLLNAEPEMRRLLGTEALMLHGASLKWIESHRHEGEEFDEQFLMDLAGNSFVGQVFAAVLLSIFVEGPLHLVAPCKKGSALLNLVDSVLGAP